MLSVTSLGLALGIFGNVSMQQLQGARAHLMSVDFARISFSSLSEVARTLQTRSVPNASLVRTILAPAASYAAGERGRKRESEAAQGQACTRQRAARSTARSASAIR